MRRAFLVLCVGVFSLAACSDPKGPDAAKPPAAAAKPVATVQEIMGSLVMPAAAHIWNSVRVEVDAKGTHEYQPQTEDEWIELRFYAKGLAESANLLIMEGHAEDQGNWVKHAKEMMEKALEVAKAAEAKDPQKILDTGGVLYENCTACHMEYLEKVVTKRTSGKPAETPLSAPPGVPAK